MEEAIVRDQLASGLRVALVVGSFALGGCGSFAFYEDTKVGIAIRVDPKAPDPVEITASFKEAVFALVPTRELKATDGQTRIDVGPVLSDFDVRYGANAGKPAADGNRDFLYAVITHGVATGPAATTLAPRK